MTWATTRGAFHRPLCGAPSLGHLQHWSIGLRTQYITVVTFTVTWRQATLWADFCYAPLEWLLLSEMIWNVLSHWLIDILSKKLIIYLIIFWSLLVSVAPLSNEVRPVSNNIPHHLGPAIPEVGSCVMSCMMSCMISWVSECIHSQLQFIGRNMCEQSVEATEPS